MNKQQLIEAIANEVDVTKATAAACLDAFINTVTKVLKRRAKFVWLVSVHLQLQSAKRPLAAIRRLVPQSRFRHLFSRSSSRVRP